MGGGVCRSARSIARGLGDLVIGKLNGDIFGGGGELVVGEVGLDGTMGPVGVDGGVSSSSSLVVGNAGLNGI